MLKLPKPVVIALQATAGIALGALWAVTALAEAAPASTATQSRAAPLLRGGDLVRLRSGGPVLTVKSVHGNWVICTWWHAGFGQFRTAGFPVFMVDGPITSPRIDPGSPTDESPQTDGQTNATERSDRPWGNLSDPGQADQGPAGPGANRTIGVSRVRPALILPQGTLRTVPQGPVQAVLPFQQGGGANRLIGTITNAR